ncbi:phosphatase PAP2 family protein [Kitasatospora camelliae]|uniref:Phosphatase PAP2 family protein n=1 Tax=Kitasatospora camelliae TaxID=3156397 RepID=A0AAU8K203_9ACTN
MTDPPPARPAGASALARGTSLWRYLRYGAWPLYLALLGWWTWEYGVPYTDDLVLCWLIGALLAAAVHSGDSWHAGLLVLRDWLPVAAVLWTYALLRGYAAHTPWPPRLQPQLAIDTVLGAGETWTVRLQHALYTPGRPRVYDYAAVAVYMTHFFAVFVLLAVLWRRDRRRFRRLLAGYLVLTYAAFATYVLYPAVPPWLAAEEGNMPEVTRVVTDVLVHSGLPRAASVFENGSRFANDVAAMPSLHAAYPMLITLFLWPTAGRRTRPLLVAYPVAMAVVLVYGGEHFVVDIALGWLYAAAAYLGVERLLARRAARRPTPTAAEARADNRVDGPR